MVVDMDAQGFCYAKLGGVRVEVRQRERGPRRSWLRGTIVGFKSGGPLIEYDELFSEDGLNKLRKSVLLPPRLSMQSPVSSRKRGVLRPIPPVPSCISSVSLKGGVFVDVYFQDAWWEAVLLDDVVSWEEDACVNVFYPDEGEVARVQLKDLRVSQLWDEATGEWNLKGSCNLSKVFKRPGITRKETVLTPSTDFEGSNADLQQVNVIKSKTKCFERVCSFKEVGQPGGNAATNALFVDMTHSVQDAARAAVCLEDCGGSTEFSSQILDSAHSSNATLIKQEPPQLSCTETGRRDVSSSASQSSNLVQTTGFGGLECTEGVHYGVKPQIDCSQSEDLRKDAVERDTVEQHITSRRSKEKPADGAHSQGTSTEIFESSCEDAGESLVCVSPLLSRSLREDALESSCEREEIFGNVCFPCTSASPHEKEALSVVVLPSLPSSSFQQDFSTNSFRHETDMVVLTPNQAGHSGHLVCRSNQHKCLSLSRELIHAIKGTDSHRIDGKGLPNSCEKEMKASSFATDLSTSDAQDHCKSVSEEKHIKQDISMDPCFEGDDASSRSSVPKMANLDMDAGHSICVTLPSQTGNEYLEDGASSSPFKASMDGQSSKKRSFDLITHIVTSDNQKLRCKQETLCGIAQADCAVVGCRPQRKTKVVEQEAKVRSGLGDKHQNNGSLCDSRIDQRLELDTLRSFRDSLLRQKRAEAMRRKTLETKKDLEKTEKPEKEDPDFQLFRKENHTESGSKASLKAAMTKDRSLRYLTRDIAKKVLLEAGFTIELRPRRSRDYQDSVYMSPEGHSHWSLPKAWDAFKKLQAEKCLAIDEQGCSEKANAKKGAMSLVHGGERKKSLSKADKSALNEVFTRYGSDERLQSALTKLGSFSSHLEMEQDVNKQVELTNADLTDILLGDLGVLRRVTKKFLNENKVNTFNCADLKTPKLSAASLIEKAGMKRKWDSAHALEIPDQMLHGGSDSLLKSREDKLQGITRSLTATATKLTGSKVKARNGKKPKARSGFRLEVRRPSFTGFEEPLCHSRRTIFAWMLDRGAVLERERIFFVGPENKQVLKEGVVTREGILCSCCKRVYTAQSFEAHAGRRPGDWYQALIFTSGKRLVDCQLKAWDAEIHLRMARNYIGVTEDDTNDDTCVHCGDGGDLICCDGCPSTFHASCLQIDDVPEGNWFCPKCTCGTCGRRQQNEEQGDLSVIFCNQCEHRYHIACLPAGHALVGKEVLCGPLCRKIFSTLRGLVGIVNPLGRGFSWTLLRSIEEDKGAQLIDSPVAIDYHSKLAVSLLVIKECFNPIIDPRTNIDMVTHAIYNRWSDFDRLNYSGFYTAVLEKEGEIISVASIRIHGVRLAEMPLIATREKFRRQGMCRLLVGVIEKLLCSLEVGFFILPAIPELFETWTDAFGFKPVDEILKSKLLDISMMVFPGTELLQKQLSQAFPQGIQ